MTLSLPVPTHPYSLFVGSDIEVQMEAEKQEKEEKESQLEMSDHVA